MNELRKLPAVDKLLANTRISKLAGFPRDLLVEVIRQKLDQARQIILTGHSCPSLDDVVNSVIEWLEILEKPVLRRVINASGVILHTNLGRAPLSEAALTAMAVAGRYYSNLEFDIESGTRGSRHVHIEGLLCQLTGAEAAFIVNNNAAAVLLGLTALAKRKEVVISRGQAVEIGGGFRIPDVMRQSGTKLIEVGTTNRTYIADYEQAITPRTAALMRIHSSNFRLVGFTSEVMLGELVSLGRKHGIMIMDDLGSGCFLDTVPFGLASEPTVQESVRAGAALTFFSGDKLVGGPQAGIIVGEKQYVEKLKKHPLARAVRIDKTRLAGLSATIIHYVKGEATTRIPVWRMIAAPLEDIKQRASLWLKTLGSVAEVVSGETMVGGGSLPGGSLPTWLVAISGGSKKVQTISRRLRLRDVPIIGRVDRDRLLLDPRTVIPEEDDIVIMALRELSPLLEGDV